MYSPSYLHKLFHNSSESLIKSIQLLFQQAVTLLCAVQTSLHRRLVPVTQHSTLKVTTNVKVQRKTAETLSIVNSDLQSRLFTRWRMILIYKLRMYFLFHLCIY